MGKMNKNVNPKSYWINKNIYSEEGAEDIFATIKPYLLEKFKAAEDEEKVKNKIIDKCQYAVSALYTAQESGMIATKQFTKSDFQSFEKCHNKYNNILSKVDPSYIDQFKDEITELTIDKSFLYTESIERKLQNNIGSLDIIETLRNIVEINNYALSLMDFIHKKSVSNCPKDELMYSTVNRLHKVYAEFTGDSEIRIRGKLQRFIEQAISSANCGPYSCTKGDVVRGALSGLKKEKSQ